MPSMATSFSGRRVRQNWPFAAQAAALCASRMISSDLLASWSYARKSRCLNFGAFQHNQPVTKISGNWQRSRVRALFVSEHRDSSCTYTLIQTVTCRVVVFRVTQVFPVVVTETRPCKVTWIERAGPLVACGAPIIGFGWDRTFRKCGRAEAERNHKCQS